MLGHTRWLIFTLSLSLLFADVVELKTGERIEGTFKQANAAGVVIEVGGQAINMPLGKVRAIYFGAAPASPAQAHGSTSSDALDALKGLNSVTTSGITYRDYAPRVLDAKVRVDRYMASAADGDMKTRIGVAMRYYELASTAWGANITKDYSRANQVGLELRADPSLNSCPGVQRVIADTDASAERVNTSPTFGKPHLRPGQTLQDAIRETAVTFTGSKVGDQPSILWRCASEKIAEAENLLK